LTTWLTAVFVGVVIIAALVVELLPDEHVERAAKASADEQSEQVVTPTAEALAGAEAQPVPPPFLLDLATGELTQLAESLADAISAYVPSPDGTRLVYEPRDETFEKIANIDGSGVRTVESPKGLAAFSARWSPDGTKLVFQEQEADTNEFGNLVVEDLASGRRTQVTDLKPGSGSPWFFLWPRFSADGQNIIFQLTRRPPSASKFDVWSVPVTGGKPTLVLRDASWPVPFPDGKSIAYVPGARGFESYSIAIADSNSSRPRTLVRDQLITWPSISPDGRKIAYTTNDDTIHVVKVARGTTTVVAEGSAAEWLDDDTLIINPD
jgi:Tol biopolymer transport system component